MILARCGSIELWPELEVAAWLLKKGADANARAAVDAQGFGGHTPLFHAVVTLDAHDDSKAHLLLKHGANPNARATFRKQLRDAGEPEKEKMLVFQDVTPIGYAKGFREPNWVIQPALELLKAHGGVE